MSANAMAFLKVKNSKIETHISLGTKSSASKI